LGNGQQYMPWISLVDLARIFEYCLTETDLDGPLNAVAPDAIMNSQFAESLAEHLSRPSFLTVHERVLKTFLGELAEELLLASTNVDPRILREKRFSFFNSSLEGTLLEILG
jgi:NAD dependent epimerase/dehydratase family enzyme